MQEHQGEQQERPEERRELAGEQHSAPAFDFEQAEFGSYALVNATLLLQNRAELFSCLNSRFKAWARELQLSEEVVEPAADAFGAGLKDEAELNRRLASCPMADRLISKIQEFGLELQGEASPEQAELLGLCMFYAAAVKHDRTLASLLKRHFESENDTASAALIYQTEAFYRSLPELSPTFRLLFDRAGLQQNNAAEFSLLRGMLAAYSEVGPAGRPERPAWFRFGRGVSQESGLAHALLDSPSQQQIELVFSILESCRSVQVEPHPKLKWIFDHLEGDPQQVVDQVHKLLADKPVLSDSDVFLIAEKLPHRVGWGSKQGHNELCRRMKEEGVGNWNNSADTWFTWDTDIVWRALDCVGAVHDRERFEAVLTPLYKVIDDTKMSLKADYTADIKQLMFKLQQRALER